MDSLNELIERLQQLHLEQARIIQALENIVAVPTDDRNEHNRTPTIVPVVAVVATTPVSTVRPAPVPTVTAVRVPVPTVVTPVPTTIFHIGQRVYITNRISHVLVRRATEADRTAIVTHFSASHVTIRTINSYHTHQHPKNLRPSL
jgi:hypothetical protein